MPSSTADARNAPSGNHGDNRPNTVATGHSVRARLYLASDAGDFETLTLLGLFCFALCVFITAPFSTPETLNKSTVIWRCAEKDRAG